MMFRVPRNGQGRRGSRHLSLNHRPEFPEGCGLERHDIEAIALAWAERLDPEAGRNGLRDMLEAMGGLVRPDPFSPLLLVAQRMDCFRVVSVRYDDLALALAHLVLHLPCREPAPDATLQNPGVLAVPKTMPSMLSLPRRDLTGTKYLVRQRTARAEAEWFADMLQMPEDRVRRLWAIHDGGIVATAGDLQVGPARLARRLAELGLATIIPRSSAGN